MKNCYVEIGVVRRVGLVIEHNVGDVGVIAIGQERQAEASHLPYPSSQTGTRQFSPMCGAKPCSTVGRGVGRAHRCADADQRGRNGRPPIRRYCARAGQWSNPPRIPQSDIRRGARRARRPSRLGCRAMHRLHQPVPTMRSWRLRQSHGRDALPWQVRCLFLGGLFAKRLRLRRMPILRNTRHVLPAEPRSRG